MLSLEVRNEGPSHSSPWFSGRKKIEWRELLGLHHWAESPWKGQHTGAGSLLRVFHVTEVAWDAFKRGLLLLQGRARAKLGQKRPEAGGQGQISSQPGQMGSLWLQRPEHWYEWVRPALPTSQGKDLAVLENWGDGGRPFHGLGQFQTTEAKLNWEKQQLHIKQWGSFESSVLGFGAQVLVMNKRRSLGGFIASTNT